MGGSQSQEEEAAGTAAAPAAEGAPAAPAAPAAAETSGGGKAAEPAEGLKSDAKGSEQKTEEKKEGCQIWIGNLVEKVATEEEIRKHFGGFGQIKDVKFKMNKKRTGDAKIFYAFATYTTLEQAKAAVEAMSGKVIAEGTEPLQVSFADRQMSEGGKGKDGKDGKGKGKDAKGGGKTGKGKGKGKAMPGQSMYPYYPYTQEQLQNAWAMHAQFYQQWEQQALQAQAYYSGFTGQVIPSQAAISAASQGTGKSTAKTPAPAPSMQPPSPPDKEFSGSVKSISSKNGYGFIICDETKALYKRDVFVESKVLPEGVEVGSKVTFTIELSEKGHPRATSVKISG